MGTHSLEPNDYQKDLSVIVDSMQEAVHMHASVVTKAN